MGRRKRGNRNKKNEAKQTTRMMASHRKLEFIGKKQVSFFLFSFSPPSSRLLFDRLFLCPMKSLKNKRMSEIHEDSFLRGHCLLARVCTYLPDNTHPVYSAFSNLFLSSPSFSSSPYCLTLCVAAPIDQAPLKKIVHAFLLLLMHEGG